MCLLSIFYGVIATWNLLEMNSSTVGSTASVSTACQSAALSTGLSSTARLSSAQLVQQFKPPKSFSFPSVSLVRKVRSEHFVLHGMKNMIGSTTMLVQMLLFVTFVCELNMKRSS